MQPDMMAMVVVQSGTFKPCKAPIRSPPPEYQHSTFLQTRCPSYHPTNSVEAMKVKPAGYNDA